MSRLGLPRLQRLTEIADDGSVPDQVERRGAHPRFRQLVDDGPDALEGELRDFIRSAPPEAIEDNPRAAWATALEWLDLPRNAIANILATMSGVEGSSKETFAGLRKVYGSDFISKMGWNPTSTIGQVGKFLVGLTGDFLLDPLTWLAGLGVARGTATSGARILGSTRAARTSAELAQEARAAGELARGLAIADEAGRVVNVRPQGLPKLIEATRGVEQADQTTDALRAAQEFAYGAPTTPAVPSGAAAGGNATAVQRALSKLSPEDVYSGRWGVGVGTHGIRTTPIASLVTGPPTILGKVLGATGEAAGRALEAVPYVGRPIGKAVGATARAAQVPLDLIAAGAEKLGTPFSKLPVVDKFVPFREMPGVGRGIGWLEDALQASPTAQRLGEAAGKVGEAVVEAGKALNIVRTPLTELAAQYKAIAERAARGEELQIGPAMRARIEQTAQAIGVPAEQLGPALVTIAEYSDNGILARAAERGDAELRRAMMDLQDTLKAQLPGEAAQKVLRSVAEKAGELLPPAPQGRPDFDQFAEGTAVRDAEGKPKALFHGTPKPGYDRFDPSETKEGLFNDEGEAVVYMAADPTTANRYARVGTTWDLDRDITRDDVMALNKRLMRGGPGIPDISMLPEPLIDTIFGSRGQPAYLQMYLARDGAGNGIAESMRNFLGVKRVERPTGTGGVYPLFAKIKQPFDLTVAVPAKTVDAIIDAAAAGLAERENAVLPAFRNNPNTQHLIAMNRKKIEALQLIKGRPFQDGYELYENIRQIAGDKAAVNEALRRSGYDGLHHIGREDGEVWIAFDPKQVKSAHSQHFDQTKPELLPPDPAGAADPFDALRAYEQKRGYNQIKTSGKGVRGERNLGLIAQRDSDPEYQRLLRAAKAAQKQTRYTETLAGNLAAEQQAIEAARQGLTTPATLKYGALADLPDDVRAGIQGEAARLAELSDNPKTQAALRAIAEGKGAKEAGIQPGELKAERERVAGVLAGTADVRTQFEKEIGVPERPADPVFQLIHSDDPLQRSEQVQAAVRSLFEGQPNELAQRAEQIVSEATGVPFTEREEVADFLRTIGQRTGIPAIGYRSAAHAKLGQAVRQGGLSDRDATVFDLSMADVSPEHLAKLDVDNVVESFAGMYRRLGERASIAFGKGLKEAPDALHEVGHFAHDFILAPEQQKVFAEWWKATPLEKRTRLFENYLDNTRAKYVAGAELTAEERASLKNLTDAQDARRLAEPQREAFAQLFAHYAITRKVNDARLKPLFDRVLDWLHGLWERLRFRGDPLDKPIVDVLESAFDRPAQAAETLFGAKGVKDPGTLVREAIGAGAKAQTADIVRWAAKNLTPEQRREIFGVAKIAAAENIGAAQAKILPALLAAGKAPGGVAWETLLRRLEDVEQGRPGRQIKRTFGLTRFDEASRRDVLTETGQQALAAMRANLAAGGDPAQVQELAAEISELRARLQSADPNQPVPRHIMRALSIKEQVLERMGRRIDADPALQAAVSNGGKPPPPPGRPLPAPKLDELFAPEIAELVRGLVADTRTRVERIEGAAGIKSPKLQTERGLGYVPHYLGDARSPVGKLIRRNGMNWEKEFKAAEAEKAGGSAETVAALGRENLVKILQRENESRAARGLAVIPAPVENAPITQQIKEVLEQFPDLTPAHRSMLARTFLREATVAELNSIADFTDRTFLDDPVKLWTQRTVMAHYVAAGADFLREAVKRGVADGWAVQVAKHGPTPEGFSRITDPRFGDLAHGYAFSDEAVKLFDQFRRVSDNPGPLLRAFDSLLSKWKTLVLAVPTYTTTNLLSGVFQANQFNGYSAKAWGAAKEFMEDYHLGRKLDQPIGRLVEGLPKEVADMSTEEFYRTLSVDLGAMGQGLYGKEMETAVAEGVRTSWGPIEQAAAAFKEQKSKLGKATVGAARAYFRGFRAANSAVEDWMKTGFIIERLRKGDTLNQAAEKARFALNQSQDLTEFERRTFRRVLPFWGWMKGNAVLQFTMAMARPQVTRMVSSIRGNLEAALVGDEQLPGSMRPKHIAGELGTQLTGGAKPEFFNLSRAFPVKELGTTPLAGQNLPAALGDALVGGFNPFAKGAIESTLNRDFYWDRPISEYEGQTKKFLGVPLSPGTKRWATMLRPLNVIEQQGWRGIPTTAGEGAAAAGQAVGVRQFEVDVPRQVFQADREISMQLGAVMRDYSRARVAAERAGADWRTDPEVQRLAEIYRELAGKRAALPIRSLRNAARDRLEGDRRQKAELKQFALGG